jgi:hypothetical protein
LASLGLFLSPKEGSGMKMSEAAFSSWHLFKRKGKDSNGKLRRLPLAKSVALLP